MEFRPCIDIHNGKVKQIVGGSLKDGAGAAQAEQMRCGPGQRGYGQTPAGASAESIAQENFVSEQDAAYFAEFYKKDGLRGGHVIMLNPPGTLDYEATKTQALHALTQYPGGLQIGGGITPENAGAFLEAGASHVIVTSYVFKDGRIYYENLRRLSDTVGRKRLVLDVSCRWRDGAYYIVTDRWQKFTNEQVSLKLLDALADFADEFLIHAADVEGRASGIETGLVQLLGDWDGCPVTYAGGVGSFADLEELKKYGKNRLHVTVGSALDLFGGTMAYQEVLEFCRG